MAEQIKVKLYTYDRVSTRNKRFTRMTSLVICFGSHIGFTLKPIKRHYSKEVLVRVCNRWLLFYLFNSASLPERQAESKKFSHFSLRTRDRDKLRAKVLLNHRFVFQSVLKISHSIEIKLFLNHKLTFVDGRTDGQTQTDVNQLLNPSYRFACVG